MWSHIATVTFYIRQGYIHRASVITCDENHSAQTHKCFVNIAQRTLLLFWIFNCTLLGNLKYSISTQQGNGWNSNSFWNRLSVTDSERTSKGLRWLVPEQSHLLSCAPRNKHPARPHLADSKVYKTVHNIPTEPWRAREIIIQTGPETVSTSNTGSPASLEITEPCLRSSKENPVGGYPMWARVSHGTAMTPTRLAYLHSMQMNVTSKLNQLIRTDE